jgi:hypothetical protein
MKYLALLAVLAVFTFSCKEVEEKEIHEDVAESSMTEASAKLRHVVMFKFKEESSVEDIDSVVKAFENLPNEIPEIKGFEWGTNNSPENLNSEFTHIFTLTFDTEEGRAAYLPHPAHKAFGGILGPHLDKVMVMDYWNK